MVSEYNPIKQAILDKKTNFLMHLKWSYFRNIQKTALDRKKAQKAMSDYDHVIKIRRFIRPFLLKLAQKSMPYKVIIENEYHPLKNKPIIFSVNHTCSSDAPAFFSSTDIHSYVLSGKQRLNFADWLFLSLNGSIWVDRKEKESMRYTKEAIEEYLIRGQSVLWFPEGTWNLTDNLPIMPLKWGIIDVAKNCNAQIIPVNLWYDRENKEVHTRFGDAIDSEKMASGKKGIEYLRDSMATLWWENLSLQKLTKRNEISKESIQKVYYDILMEYPPLDIEYEQSIIYSPSHICKPEDAFLPIKNLPVKMENLFLIRKIS